MPNSAMSSCNVHRSQISTGVLAEAKPSEVAAGVPSVCAAVSPQLLSAFAKKRSGAANPSEKKIGAHTRTIGIPGVQLPHPEG